ncbi:hypothetical protein N219_09740 [Limosilactobacillus fermentum MTCC 8711]|nr:hypothetical protein N219_09740 [Limosilactobacillus fermentum MTCC 8711]
MTKLVRAVLVLILLMATIANLGTNLKQGRGALLIVLAGLALAPRVWRWLSGRLATTKRNLCWGLLGLTVVIELTVLLTMPTSVFHDPFRVRYQASLLASGHFDWGTSDYFYRYPNNAVNAVLLAGPLWVGRLVGLNDATTLGALGFVMTNALILACALLGAAAGQRPGRRRLSRRLVFAQPGHLHQLLAGSLQRPAQHPGCGGDPAGLAGPPRTAPLGEVTRPRRGGPGRPVDQAQPDRLGAGRFVNLVLGQTPPPAPGPGYYGFGCLGPNVAG